MIYLLTLKSITAVLPPVAGIERQLAIIEPGTSIAFVIELEHAGEVLTSAIYAFRADHVLERTFKTKLPRYFEGVEVTVKCERTQTQTIQTGLEEKLKKALCAITHVLKRIRDEKDVRFQLGYGTQSFNLLTESYSLLTSEEVESVQAQVLGKETAR